MKIEAYVICKNEELIMPHLLNHYSKFCNTITFFDNESTDKTRDIINAFDKCNTRIITNSTNGQIRDDIYIKIKDTCWKNSEADYVVVIDADEFLYHDDLLKFLSENKYDVYYPTGYNMISNHFPLDYSKPITDQVILGDYAENYSKSIIFNPKTIKEINYDPGAHTSKPIGYSDITIYRGTDLKLLHYKNLGFHYRYNKNSTYGTTLSDFNKQHGFGFHYNFSKDQQFKEFVELYNSRKTIINNTPDVSFVITTCGRLDLLERTLNSFFNVCKYPFKEYIMTDDSGDPNIYQNLVNRWGNVFKIIRNEPRLGLSKSIDRLYTAATSEYIFHCEDDWLFDSNENLITDSLSILQENRDIHQVHVRHLYDTPLKPEGELLMTMNFVEYKKIQWLSMELQAVGNTDPRAVWTGYSWNPGLRRKSDYLKMFPNGVSDFGDEVVCSKHSIKFDYSSVTLNHTACSHIGYDRHTTNFLI